MTTVNSMKIVIPVPDGVRYISQWNEFSLNRFNGAYIIDKQIPGCGFTEFCLTCEDNIILCSPRKILLANKQNQHPDDIHYAKNELETDPEVDVDTKSSKPSKSSKSTSKKVVSEGDPGDAKKQMFERLEKYTMKMLSEGKPMKIIVTYDSFRHVKEYLENYGNFKNFKIVVDEFQSIFIDSHFKASTEFDFFNLLKTVPNNLCFVSATPMIDEYLFRLPEFKSMPYYQLDWSTESPGRVMKPILKVKKIKSVLTESKQIIKSYLDGNYSILSNPVTGDLVQSKEAVFYLNSVNDILKVINGAGLNSDQCNILCSDTISNRNKIKKKLGTSFKIGSVPLKGEPHKMFTFCTRTVYLGADFYSTNARTFILSDANIDSLSVDISLDLPQILGRQRLIENPWKNHAEFYFKPLGDDKEIDPAVFQSILDQKTEETITLIKAYDEMTNIKAKQMSLNRYADLIQYNKYSKDYISINTVNGVPTLVFNELVKISEQRAFDIQQVDYKNRFTVFNSIKSSDALLLDKMSHYIDLLRDPKMGTISNRLRMLCDNLEFSEEDKKTIAKQVSEKFDKYYNIIGPKRCRELGFNITSIRQEIENMKINPNDIRSAFLNKFNVGDNLPKSEIKKDVGYIYQELGLTKKAKATDLSNYFEIRATMVKDKTGTWVNSLEILSRKPWDIEKNA